MHLIEYPTSKYGRGYFKRGVLGSQSMNEFGPTYEFGQQQCHTATPEQQFFLPDFSPHLIDLCDSDIHLHWSGMFYYCVSIDAL